MRMKRDLLGLDSPWIKSQWGAIPPARVQTGPASPCLLYSKYPVSFPQVKRLGCCVDHWLLS